MAQSLGIEVAFPNFQPPSVHTNDLIGVDYLYAQSGNVFCPNENDVDDQVDEVFDKGIGKKVPDILPDLDELPTVAPPTNHESEEKEEVLCVYYLNFT